MFYIPIGPPGAGKSTLARRMFHNDSDAIVCPDEYRRILCGDQTSQKYNKQVFEVIDIIKDIRLKNGLDVYLDATNLNIDNLVSNFNIARGYGQDVTVFISDLSSEQIYERNSSEHRIKTGTIVPDYVMKRMITNYQRTAKLIDALVLKYPWVTLSKMETANNLLDAKNSNEAWVKEMLELTNKGDM